MADLIEMDKLTRKFADARDTLTTLVNQLNATVEDIQREYMKKIKTAFEVAAEKKTVLHDAIESSPELFTKPKSMILHGIKIGYAKGKGTLEIEDDAQTVKLIKKHFPGKAEALIKTVETPIKKALNNLPVADLKKIGITVEETGEMVIIKPVASDIDKLVAALFKQMDKEMES